MKQIDVIFPVYINAPIGPTGTLRRLMASREYLGSRGYEINVFTLEMLYGQSVETPVDFSKGLKARSTIKEKLKKNRLLSTLFQIRNDRIAYKLVDYYLSLNRKPAVIVFHEFISCAYYTRVVKNSLPVVLFHHCDGDAIEMLFKSYPKLRNSWYARKAMRQYNDTIRTVSMNAFISYGGRDNFLRLNPDLGLERTNVFHNGIDDKQLIPNKGENSVKYRLCTTGTVCARKGQYIIVEALKNMKSELRNQIHVNVYGEGQDFLLLQDRAKEYGVEENISFEGFIPNNQIHEYLSKNNIYILMSNNEGLPISIIEAMRAGLGVISTRIAGIPEEVDGRNGVLIDPDINQLTNLFNHIYDYDWDLMGYQSRKRFEEEFTFTQMIKSYCDMMDRIK